MTIKSDAFLIIKKIITLDNDKRTEIIYLINSMTKFAKCMLKYFFEKF